MLELQRRKGYLTRAAYVAAISVLLALTSGAYELVQNRTPAERLAFVVFGLALAGALCILLLRNLWQEIARRGWLEI